MRNRWCRKAWGTALSCSVFTPDPAHRSPSGNPVNTGHGFSLYCCFSVPKSCLTLLQPPGLVACQALLSMGFPRQEYWSRLPFCSPGHLPYPGIKPVSFAMAGRFFTTEPPGILIYFLVNASCRISYHS